MEMLQLTASKRDKIGRSAAKKLRDDGYLPGVLYGHGTENIHLALPQAEMATFFRRRGRILDLEIDGQNERAIVKDIQYNAFGDEIIHLDLLRISLDEVISVRVPINVVGTAKGVEQGGVLQVLRQEIEVKCLPALIPAAIDVVVTDLGLQDSLHLKDLVLPEGVALDDEPEYAVVSVVAKSVEAPPAAPAAGEAAEGEKPEGEPEAGEKSD